MRRFLAILVIWLGAAAAWMVLGSTLLVRSGEVGHALRGEVHQLWGAPIEQRPPTGVLLLPGAAAEAAIEKHPPRQDSILVDRARPRPSEMLPVLQATRQLRPMRRTSGPLLRRSCLGTTASPRCQPTRRSRT